MIRRILVLGGGFAGINAANGLAATIGTRRKVRVTLVSDRAHFLFTPLLPNAASGDVALPSISVPLENALHPDVEVQIDRVDGLDLQKRRAFGHFHHDFDLALIAPGSVTDWDGHPEWAQFAKPCKNGSDAAAILDHMRKAFHMAASVPKPDRARWLTFVIAGAGPTGISLLAELHTLLRDELSLGDARLAEEAHFVLVDRDSELLTDLDPALREICQRHLETIGVELRLGEHVEDCGEGCVTLSCGETIETESFFWCGGVRANPLLEQAGLQVDDKGRAIVDSTLSTSHQSIYVGGDCASTEYPWTAQVATQHAQIIAQNLVADLSGRSHKRWDYVYHGDILTLGRDNAAVMYRGVAFEGRAARALYQMVYTALVPSNMRKLLVFRDWWSSDRKSRQELLTASES